MVAQGRSEVKRGGMFDLVARVTRGTASRTAKTLPLFGRGVRVLAQVIIMGAVATSLAGPVKKGDVGDRTIILRNVTQRTE
jgi:hypothetical protein